MNINNSIEFCDLTYGNGLIIRKISSPKVTKKNISIIFFHGGGWFGGSINMLERHAIFYAELGIDAYCVQYRTHEKFKTTPLDAVNDSISCIEYFFKVMQASNNQNHKVVLFGASAGGLLALVASQFFFIDALILFNPVTDLSNSGFSNRMTRLLNEQQLYQISPLNIIKGKTLPPTIIFHGDADTVVPISSTTKFYLQMKNFGSDITLLKYKNVGHGFFNYNENNDKNLYFEKTLITSVEFLDKKLMN